MMMHRKVLDRLGGYDEALAYEDFDFWVRSARLFGYFYVDRVLMKKRRVRGSLSSKQYAFKSKIYAESTLAVCQKIKALNRSETEDQALGRRITRELRTAFFCACFETVQAFYRLKKETGKVPLEDRFFNFLARKHLNLFGIYHIYLKIKRKV